MKLCCISDLHGQYSRLELPEADVLVCAGDLTGHGGLYEIQMFFDWFSAQTQYKARVTIAGNHDWSCEKTPQLVKTSVPSNVIYLFDESIDIDGYMFYGTPWQPIFLDWAFNLSEEKLVKKWEKIPKGTDVLITHGPPFGILDLAQDGRLCGSPSLLDKVSEVEPLAHVFGHIHEAAGIEALKYSTTFVNASVLNRRYQLVNKPIVIDICK